MRLKPGEASARVLKDLEGIVQYYKPARCYRSDEEVDCFKLALELLWRDKISFDTTVCNERKGLCLKVKAGSELSTIEFSGVEVYFMVDATDFLEVGDLIARVVTGKGEVRSIRSKLDGYVLLLHEDSTSKPQKYYVILSREGAEVSGAGKD